MKELGQGLWALIFATIVSVFVIVVGTLYSFGYSIYMSGSGKDWKAFFKFWWRLIDGWCAALGYVLYEVAYAMDLGWNVNGEIIEDMVTAHEQTTFSEKNITVSASVGKLEVEDKLNKSGKKFSSLLSFFFGQKFHARDSWEFLKAKNDLRNQYFK